MACGNTVRAISALTSSVLRVLVGKLPKFHPFRPGRRHRRPPRRHNRSLPLNNTYYKHARARTAVASAARAGCLQGPAPAVEAATLRRTAPAQLLLRPVRLHCKHTHTKALESHILAPHTPCVCDASYCLYTAVHSRHTAVAAAPCDAGAPLAAARFYHPACMQKKVGTRHRHAAIASPSPNTLCVPLAFAPCRRQQLAACGMQALLLPVAAAAVPIHDASANWMRHARAW